MTETKRPVNSHKAYHAHIYFDEGTTSHARMLCEQSGEKFGLKVGRFHERPIGPQPCWSCQVTFGTKDFEAYISWLEENRAGLTILVHALTGDDYKDHTEFAYWLGEAVELNLGIFNQSEKG